MKRLIDIAAAAIGLIVGSLVIIPAAMAVWMQDWRSPFYVAPRAGLHGTTFRMVKLRSMRFLADRTGVMSTSGDDPRITAVGRFVRRWKVDELTQLWNVLKGDMSLVGPRPQVLCDVAKYTSEEREMLTVRPGITDIASIVFADEGEILRGAEDPDSRYDHLIRPWKSRLALLYVHSGRAMATDLRVLYLTAFSIVSRPAALAAVSRLVRDLGGDEILARVAVRNGPLDSALPPGSSESEVTS